MKAAILVLLGSTVFAESPLERLYFEKDENFATTPKGLKKVKMETKAKYLESPMSALPTSVFLEEYDFDPDGYKISATSSSAPWGTFFGVVVEYKNDYELVGDKERRIIKQSRYQNGLEYRKVYEYSGLGIKVVERSYVPGSGEEADEMRYTEWRYDWFHNRLATKDEFYSRGEARSVYRYYECYDLPWYKKRMSVTTVRSDYNEFFKPVNPVTHEVISGYDNGGRLKDETFLSENNGLNFINIYDERGDCVEVKGYYPNGVLASRGEHRHFYKKINGMELRARTEITTFLVEFKDREDGWADKIETPINSEVTTYEYEFYK